CEIIMRESFAFAASRVMPVSPKLASAAQMRNDTWAAAFEPELAKRCILKGGHRDSKPSVTVKVHRGIAGFARRPDLHIGNGDAITRLRLMPCDSEPGWIECSRRLLQ